MAILKIEILGSQIQINYEINEREKLINLIENFKKRLSDFPNNERISNNTIIFLAALKVEDQLAELKIVADKSTANIEKINKQVVTINKLNNEVTLLQDQLKELNLSNIYEKNISSKALEALDRFEKKLESIQKKIKDSIQ
jgi:cell division protein ZapA (FtsZ GTPase activity inhibitor)